MDYFIKEDLDILFYELFAKVDKDKCDETVIQFVNTHPELLKKIIKKNTYGIPEKSTALHVLAKDDYGAIIESGYMSSTFFRNIYTDITIIINCLHKNMDNKELYTNLKNSNIIDKKDSNDKTVLEIVNDKLKLEPENAKYKKLKEILEVIRKSVKIGTPEIPDNNSVKSGEIQYYKIVVDESSILEETSKNKQKIIKLKQTKNKKPYRILVSKRKSKKN